jgi:hypothetical protein
MYLETACFPLLAEIPPCPLMTLLYVAFKFSEVLLCHSFINSSPLLLLGPHTFVIFRVLCQNEMECVQPHNGLDIPLYHYIVFAAKVMERRIMLLRL